MRHALIAALLLGAAAPALAQTVPAPAAAPATLDSVIPAIDANFRQFMEAQHIPGLVYGIVRDGRLVHVGAFGVQELEQRRPVNADSLFRIASMSKAFTALAILKLRDEGRLRLDDLAETYVPEMRNWRYPTSDSPRITIRDLLSHTGGLVTDNPWGDRQQVLSEEEFTRMLREGVPFERAPGTQMEYSNFGYALLGRIVTNVSGRPFEDYIQAEIMRPLGMASTNYDVLTSPRDRRAIGYRWENDQWVREPDMRRGAFGAMGGVETSANDYARWAAFLLSAWPARDGPETGPVRRASVRELAEGLGYPSVRTRPGLEGMAPCNVAMAYGKGMGVGIDCDLGLTVSHSGGYPGYGSFLMLMPEADTAIFAFSSRTYGGVTPAVMNAGLELARAGLLPRRAWPVSEPLARAYAMAGTMWAQGSVAPGRDMLAMNFLMDRSEENWAREFARLKEQTGACPTGAALNATGAMEARFTWTCERATVNGYLLLAPTNPQTIQQLSLRIAP
jgi:CubicO group peptidase (beta-lactamase class C family)